jgi:methionyl-tRNA formyltransferase
MRVLFWGTPLFAVPTLRALGEEGHEVVAVVTQPDRPAGRGRHTRPSPVREVAEAEGLPVLTPERPRGEDFVERLRALDVELSVVAAYGHILRPDILDLPPRGSINVHASLLPRLRGAAPVHWAIARGDTVTGVTVMRMVEAMDAGPILLQVEEPIGPSETSSELATRLSEIGAQALIETLALLDIGAAVEQEQDHERATYAPKVDRTAARIDWSLPAARVVDHVRAMDEVPGAWSTLSGAPMKLFRPRSTPHVRPVGEPGEAHADADPRPAASDAPPGSIVDARPGSGRGLGVACGEGVVWFADLQPPGGRRMEVDAWLRGHGAAASSSFE